jgi:serpin B
MRDLSQVSPIPTFTRRAALKAGGLGLLGLGTVRLANLARAAAGAGLWRSKDVKSDVAAVVKSNDAFAFDLYAKLREKEGNLFFSPESISTALAMTYAGARGETAAEMAKTLHFTLKPDQIHPAFHALIDELNGARKKRGYQLTVANALWGQKGFNFLPDFIKLTKANYGAGLHEVDFAGNTEAARKTINAWVEKETKDKIKDLLQPGVLDSLTRLVLTNAIYFKGNWDRQFKKDLTKKDAFHVSGDKKIDALLMHDTGKFKYFDGGSFQALEMPYKGKELSMVVLLPKKIDGLGELEKTLTAAAVAEWLPKLREQEVAVSLPKFKSTSEFSLNDTLETMGIKQLFAAGAADLSGMDGKRDLFVSAVVHKAYVDVNEEGTEAAGATSVVVKLEAAPFRPEFRADHPFVFLIRDNHSSSTLFLGRVVNPQT